MTYQSDGLQNNEENRAKPFLGQYAEEIIRDYRKRIPRAGAYALRGEEDSALAGPNRKQDFA